MEFEKNFQNKLHYIILFFILLIYIRTIPFSIYPGDPGELITAGYTLGIAHPPGYPFYVFLSKIFTTAFPLGNIAFRVNILTMVLTIIGLLIFFKTIKTFFNSLTAAGFCTILLAFTPALWGQSLIGEVYSLNFLFLTMLLYLELNNPDNILIYYIYGLSLANHHTMLLFAPFFILKIIKEKKFTDITIYIVFLLGLSPYLYIYLRSREIPLFNWGNPSTLSGLLHHITRSEYGPIIKNPFSIIHIFKEIWSYILSLSAQFNPLLAIAGFAAFLSLPQKKYAFLTAFLMSGIFVILLLNIPLRPRELFDVEVFYIPSFTIFSIFLASGIVWIDKKTDVNLQNKYLVYLLLIVILSYQIIHNYGKQNRSNQNFSYNYGVNILNTIRSDGLIFVEKDNIASALSYLMLVENKRKDIIFYNPALQIIRNLYPSTKIENDNYIKNKSKWKKIPFYRSNPSENFYRDGILFTSWPTRKISNIYYNLKGIYNNPNILNNDFENRTVITDELFSEIYFYNRINKPSKSDELMSYCSKVGFDNFDVHVKLAIDYEMNQKFYKALDEYNLILPMVLESPDIYCSIGFIYYELGNYLLSYEYFNKALAINPDYPNVYFGLAQNEEKFGKTVDAVKHWKKFLELQKEPTVWKLEAERRIGHIKKGI